MNTNLALFAAAVMSMFGVATSTPATPSAPPAPVVVEVSAPCVNLARTLTYGARGTDVAMMQEFLSVEKTGYFGRITRQKLAEWQVSARVIPSVTADGASIAGPKTRAAMRCAPVALRSASSTSALASTTVATTTGPVIQSPVVPAAAPVTSGGGGGGSVAVPSVSPYGYLCTPVTDQPASGPCTGGTWELSFDEAGCIVWACLMSDDRG